MAPLEVFHVNVGLVETPVAPLVGDDSVGAAGIVAVVKIV